MIHGTKTDGPGEEDVRRKYSEQERQYLILLNLFENKRERDDAKSRLESLVQTTVDHLAKIWMYPDAARYRHNPDTGRGWMKELSDYTERMASVKRKFLTKEFILQNTWRYVEYSMNFTDSDQENNDRIDSTFKKAIKNARADVNEFDPRVGYKRKLSGFRSIVDDYFEWLADEMDNAKTGISTEDVEREVYRLVKRETKDDYERLDKEYFSSFKQERNRNRNRARNRNRRRRR